MSENSDLLESSASEEAVNQDANLSQDHSAEDAAQSSGAKDGEQEKDLLSVVRDALQPEDKASTAEADSSSVDGSEGAEEGEGEDDTESSNQNDDDEDHTDLPFHKHPRFRQLIRERNELKVRANEFDQLNTFMHRFSIQPEETANAFKIMALAKSDPAKALEELKAVAHVLAVQAGEVLPDDLNSKVEQGYLDRDTALELSRAKARADAEAARRYQLETRYETEQADRQVNVMAEAVTAWEDQARRNDPDYSIKADMVDDRVRALVAERGKPKTTDEALAIAKEAYETVSKRLRSVMPNKTPMRSVIGGKVSGTPTPEPKSVLDVIQNSMVGKV